MGCPEDLHGNQVIGAAQDQGCRNQYNDGQNDAFSDLPPQPAGLCGKRNHASNAQPHNQNPNQEKNGRHNKIIENHPNLSLSVRGVLRSPLRTPDL
jgi:hypothetical protein